MAAKHTAPKPSSDVTSQAEVSPIAPLDDHEPEDKYGSFAGQSPQPRKGGRSSGIVGQTRQRFGTSRSKKDNKPTDRGT